MRRTRWKKAWRGAVGLCLCVGSAGSTPLKDRLIEAWRTDPPEAVYLSLDRSPQEELAMLHLVHEQFPRHAGVAHRRALLLYVLGYRSEADTAYRAARRVAPDWEFIMFHALQALSTPSGDALSAYREAVHVDRRHSEVRWALGFLALSARRYPESLEHYDQWDRLSRSAQSHLSSASAWQTATLYNYAVAAFLAGEDALAERLVKELEDRHVVHWRTSLLQGHLSAGRGKEPEALSAYQDALRLAPQRIEPAFYAALAAGQLRQWPAALTAIEQARQGDPRSPRVLAERQKLLDGAWEDARGALARERPEHAAALAALIVSLDPGHADAAELRQEALDHHQRARRLEGALGEALALETAEPDRALAVYEEILTLVPDHPVALRKTAVLRGQTADTLRTLTEDARQEDRRYRPHRALALLERAQTLQPGHPESQQLQRDIERRLTTSRAQRDVIDRHTMAGEVAASEGDWDRAIRLWKSALEFDYYNEALRNKIRFAEQDIHHREAGGTREK